MLLRRARFTAASTVSALALLVTGCGSEEPVRSATAPSETPSSASSTPSASSSPSPEASAPGEPASSSATEPTASSSPSPTPPAGPTTLSDRLLTAEQMPAFNERWTWKVASTRDEEGAEPFGTCHKVPMTSIGAVGVVVRTFTAKRYPEDPGSASQLVAEFPDGMTAKRAYAVLESWRADCEDRLRDYDRRTAHDFEPVDVPGGVGGWYLLIYGPPEGGSLDDGYFDAQGLVRVGKLVSVLQMRGIGQDYNYTAGEEPMVGGVERAAAGLG